jgi:hypothetical protein
VAAATDSGQVGRTVPRETIHALGFHSDTIGRQINLSGRDQTISRRESKPTSNFGAAWS